jgi:phosphatidylglycerophosphatase C
MQAEGAVALFDFDGTLISTDSFRLLSLMAAGSPVGQVHMGLLAVACRLGLIDNDGYKQRVLRAIWQGRSPAQRERLLGALQERLGALLRAGVAERLRQHVRAGDRVAVISASPLCYLEPFMQQLAPGVEVHGSQMRDTAAGVALDNLYGTAKLGAARAVLGRHPGARSLLYTDSLSDLPLMQLVDHTCLVAPASTTVRTLRRLGLSFEVITP